MQAAFSEDSLTYFFTDENVKNEFVKYNLNAQVYNL